MIKLFGVYLRLVLFGWAIAANDFQLGNEYLAKGQLSDALTHFHEAINTDPSNYQALFRRALTYLALSRPSSAITDFQTVLNLKPDFINAQQHKADILLKQGKFEEAEEIYTKLGDSGKLAELNRLRNKYEEIDHYFENQDYQTTENLISEIIEDQKWNVELFRKRAKCAEKLGNVKKSVRNLKQIIKLSPDSTDVMHEVSQALYQIGDFDDSLKMIRECLKLNPDHKECFGFYKSIKKLVKSLDTLKQSIEEKNWEKCLKTGAKIQESFANTKSSIQFLTLQCNRESGNSRQAIDDASELLDSSEDVEIRRQRALAYIEESEFDEAAQDLNKILDIEPNDREAKELLGKVEKLKKQAGKRDYYKILGVKRSARKKEIVKAYRQLAQKWHPDNFKNENEKKKAEKKFIDIAAAKEVLTDKEKREQFDNGIDPLDPEASQHGHHHHHGFHGFDGFNPFGAGGGGPGGNFHFFYN